MQMTDCPKSSPSFGAILRLVVSDGPPGANWTINSMGFVGNSAPQVKPQDEDKNANSNSSESLFGIFPPINLFLLF
jgi:hypothetical protein